MKKINLISLLTVVSLFLTANVWAQVPAHGSLSVQGDVIFTETLPATAPVATDATMDYKVVTMAGKTYVWMKASAGNFWADQNSEFGYTTDDATYTKAAVRFQNLFGGNREIQDVLSIAIPATDAKVFMRPQINLEGASGNNGNHHTTPVAYNPAAYNSATSDNVKPVFAEAPEKVVTSSSITIALNATDNSNDLFYYVESEGISDVVFSDDVTYTIPAGADLTYTVYAVDFSGNVSDPQVVKTINESAAKLPTPTGLSLDASKKILSFGAVANASSYLVMVVDESDNIIFEQENFTIGGELKYFLAGNLTIKVAAVGDGDTYSNSEFASLAWGVQNTDLDLDLTTEYDGSTLFDPTGNNGNASDVDAAYFAWTTAATGEIVISIKANFLVNGTDDQTVFRALPGTDVLSVNGDANTGGKYFTNSLQNGGKDLVWTPVAGKTIPYGSEIRYNGMLLYKTVVDRATSDAVLAELGLGGFLDDLWPTFNSIDPFIYGSGSDGGPGTGIADKTSTKSSFFFYPNPATDVINFGSMAKEVKIYSLQGQLVLSQVNVSNVNVSGLTKGMYIIQAVDNAGKQASAKVEVK